MNIEGKTVLVTGSNRGIGAAIVRKLLKSGAGKIYAGARNISSLPNFNDPRVVPIQLDITNGGDISNAVQKIGALDVLINNAGVLNFNEILTASSDALAADMNVNYFGTVRMMQAFAPVIEKNGSGLIANVVSVVGLAPIAGIAGYSASKAALFSATQAARTALKQKNIRVVGIFPGPIDTEMAAEIPMDKASPDSAADDIIKGIIAGQDDIFPDPTSKQVAELWAANPKGLENYFAGM